MIGDNARERAFGDAVVVALKGERTAALLERIETLTAAVNECIETLEAEGMDATFFRELVGEPDPATEVYVVEWQSYAESAVVMVTLDKAQAEAYAAEKNAERKSRFDLEYTVSPWTLGEVEDGL